MSEPEIQLRDFEDQFVYGLRGIYDAEAKLVDALDELSRTTTDEDLEKGFALHRNETETQVQRVVAAFDALGVDPTRRTDRVVDGLFADEAEFERRVNDDDLRDRRYLSAAIRIERIEISTYEGLLATAEKAGLDDAVTDPLADTLEEERKTLRKLQGLAGEATLQRALRAATDF